MVETTGLNNRVYQMLSQKSSKVAVDILGMRLSTNYKNKFTEIMITETEAFGRKNTDPMSLVNMFNRKFPESLPKGPPHILVLKSYGENKSLYLLTSRKGSCEAVLIRSGVVLLGKSYVESRRKVKMKTNKVTGPGNITKGLGIDLVNDGEDLFSGSLNLATRIHPVDRAIATQRKNAKSKDRNLWRYSLVQK
ncbi:DNA-3-methyladenine glycosylase [Candidatus Actinomarina sp.]|jgi:3-methyladenine DNA glycosylase Mpg|nr:DNA-3-methyladenine glycosylase [Acidimicrobiia bacterium]MDA7850363.1 DNA-3-methyladenine glycosylase [Acidimicrobiaceae bacterium]MDA8652600.1 DNA-3-methyladenine glycosylase [Candidatus Actinomarina sp.]MDA9198094.1 DNA-3-methyladenine glycosylase [Acidimicrobiia bacterium]MDA9209700.1 DNA-3-methyladenine glycosylase [Acidimicrobiia bacterium]|tara:strand:+ start:4368 stop:4946 length:579 start_codon:yes stop_codon:yes gene_type:complete